MILFLLIVIVVAVVLEKKSLKLPMEGVHYMMEPMTRSVEQGEEFILRTTVENRTGCRIPYLFLEESIPNSVEIKDKELLNFIPDGDFQKHCSTMFIEKNQRVRRSIRATVHRRGIIYFKEAELHVGDFLGIKEKWKEILQNRSIVVYPRRLQDERLEQVLGGIVGEVSVQSFLFEDPILVRGYRDYTGTEPLRAISFLQSAKRNQLTVKEFDHTREEMVDIIFDVGYRGDFEHYNNQKETMFCLVRTICETFEARHIAYRLITNAYYATMETHGVNVLTSGGNAGSNYAKILEMLGMALGAKMCDTEELLGYAFQRIRTGMTVLYVAQRPEEESESKRKAFAERYGVSMHCMYGSEYEESYLSGERKTGEKAS